MSSTSTSTSTPSVIVNIDLHDVELVERKETTPYQVSPSLPTPANRRSFWCWRAPTYLMGWLCGLLRFVFGCFCCRKTYDIIADDALDRVFQAQWPYVYLLEPVTPELLLEHRVPRTLAVSKILDTRIMDQLEPFTEYNCMGVVAFFNERSQLVAMRRSIDKPERPMLTRLGHSGAARQHEWDVGKLFLMQGAHYLIKFGMHSELHFRQSSFVAIFQQYFRAHECLYQLLAPHMEFVPVINESVLEGISSVLNAHYRTCCCWDAQTTDRVGIQKVILLAATKYRRLPGFVPHRDFEPAYRELYTFALQVCNQYLAEHRTVRQQKLVRWCTSVNVHLQLNLNHDELGKPETVARLLAWYIFQVSIWHAADHYGLQQVSLLHQPMSIRLDPANPRTPCCCWQVVSLGDFFRHFMYSSVFVKWWNNCCCYDTRLVNVAYGFAAPRLQRVATRFRQRLRTALRQQHFIPSSEIAKSIEW